MIVTVYKITNLVNGRCYIGITKQTSAFRWRQHVLLALRGGRKGALQGAIVKYGEKDFEVSDIYEATSVREAQAVERGLIAQYGTMWPNGYNMSTGGEFRTGYKISDATRKKMRQTALGREIGERQRSLASENMKRLWQDTKYREQMAVSQNTDEARASRALNNAKISAARRGQPGFFLGKSHTAETKAILSIKGQGRAAWNKGIPMSEEQKAMLVAIHKGSKHTKEHKQKISAALNKPETKARMVEITKERWATPEGRQRMIQNRTYPKPPPLTDEQRSARSEMMRKVMSSPERKARASKNGKAQWADPEKRARGIVAAKEKGLRRVETRLYGHSTADLRALARKLPAVIYPREAA